jgi:hypothetical protein
MRGPRAPRRAPVRYAYSKSRYRNTHVSIVLGRGPLIRVFLKLGFGFQTHSGTDVKLEIYTLIGVNRDRSSRHTHQADTHIREVIVVGIID